MKRGRRSLGLDYAGLHDRYLAGESSIDIAASVGIDASGLRRAWTRRGLPIRSGSDAHLAMHRQRPDLRSSVEVAHAARRGRTDPIERRERRAQTREARLIGVSDHELRLAERLREAGLAFRQQAAIGPYNVDFLIGDVALDIDGGGHSPRARASRPTRDAFLRDRGYRVVAIGTRHKDWIDRALHAALPKIGT